MITVTTHGDDRRGKSAHIVSIIWLGLSLVLGAGCSQVNWQPLSNSALVGEYTSGDPFCPRILRLDSDGKFSYDQHTDVALVRPDGSLVFEGSWGRRGNWTYIGPDRVVLTNSDGAHAVSVYVRRKPDGKLVILEPELYPAALKDWPAVQVSWYLERR